MYQFLVAYPNGSEKIFIGNTISEIEKMGVKVLAVFSKI
jgi:nucleoside diphosphate kinase